MTLNALSTTVVIPNAAIVKAALQKAVDNRATIHPDVGTQGYAILDKTGFDTFLDRIGRRARVDTQEILTQFFVNGDDEGAKKFLDALVDDVIAELEKMKLEAGSTK